MPSQISSRSIFGRANCIVDYSAIPYAIYSYLRRQDRRAEVQVLWHGYSTRWLARKFPEDATILLSNTTDGRSLKNRGYRSKESVDRLAPDFDREARSEGWREFGL